MAKCQEGKGYGITIKDDNYDLDDYEADRIVDRVNLVESCISFTKYNSNPKLQEGYDLFIKSVSVAYEPFTWYLI